MDTLSSILLWAGIGLFFIGLLSFFLYYRRLFDPEASKEYAKTFSILASIGAVLMSISLYIKKVADLKTILLSLVVFIAVLAATYIVQLVLVNRGADFYPKDPRVEHPFPIDRIKASLRKYIQGRFNPPDKPDK